MLDFISYGVPIDFTLKLLPMIYLKYIYQPVQSALLKLTAHFLISLTHKMLPLDRNHNVNVEINLLVGSKKRPIQSDITIK